jgi:ubiquinone/menaquinone biosynthesis C-methylase UbiE
MPTPTNPSENQTTYFINPEEAAETSRLLMQDREVTKEMGGIFPASLDLSSTHLVLDMACGPGGWACEVAHTYPQMDVVGVDISEKMIRYAQAHARTQSLDNASFQVMDLLKPVEFPDDAFDFVNARFISPFMRKDAWPRLLAECMRITRPGGIVRITDGEWQFSNGEASEKIADMLTQASWLAGKSFSPNGRRFGTTLVLSQFMRDAGLTNLQRQPFALDYSYGTPAHETFYQEFVIGAPLLLPFLQGMGMTTKEEFDRLYNQLVEEMQQPSFRGLWFFLSVWGTKPESPQQNS